MIPNTIDTVPTVNIAIPHHLVSGDRKTIHKFNHSMQGKGIPDDKIPEEEWEDHIIWME